MLGDYLFKASNLSVLFFGALSLLSHGKTLSLSAEAAYAWTAYNYFQIPGNISGSRVDLEKGKAIPAYRIYADLELSENWSLRLLYAPLTAKYKTTPSTAISFDGENFGANDPLAITYKFNSYRASIIRKWGASNETQWRVGFTTKVRDAYINMSNSQKSNRYSNIGFVPLLFLGVWTPLNENFALSADIDGLAGGPGRAFDGRFQSEYKISDLHQISLGYRFLEGGVKNNKVNNFALFHFLYAGYTASF